MFHRRSGASAERSRRPKGVLMFKETKRNKDNSRKVPRNSYIFWINDEGIAKRFPLARGGPTVRFHEARASITPSHIVKIRS